MNTSKPIYSLNIEEVYALVNSSPHGLTDAQVIKSQEEFGPNKLPEGKGFKVITLFFSQFKNAMVVLMFVAAFLSFILGHVLDTSLILGIVVVNTIMGFFQEYRAEKSIAALKKMLITKVVVRRNGRLVEIPQEDITVGDIIQLQEGMRVPADARIIFANNCLVSEASLTGESMPVEKLEGVLGENSALGDRKNMLMMGTTVLQGNAEAIVVATGIHTEFGKIATSLQSVSSEKEHFSQKVSILSRQMGFIAIFSAFLTFLVGFFWREFTLSEISIYTIATLISALPEGLPIILVIVLAVGAQKMAKKNAIIRKLSATETLGVVSVIITDKTGTITQNIMSASKVYLPSQQNIDINDETSSGKTIFSQQNESLLLHDNPQLHKLILISKLCNQVKISDENNISFTSILGDPTEKALFLLAHKAGIGNQEKDKIPKVIDDLPFQQHLRLRASLVKINDHEQEVYFLGAPESILKLTTKILTEKGVSTLTPKDKKQIESKIEEFSDSGLRLVSLAYKKTKDNSAVTEDLLEKDGIFVGLVGIYDPPRPEVANAIKEAEDAGIKTIMATGDHPRTALAISKKIGLVPNESTDSSILSQTDIENSSPDKLWELIKNKTVLARLTPNMKMKIAETFQKNGKIIAMTGDGVNDAPALKKADVGISMGITGTDVAREASKIVLTDDNFASIIAAIKEGRTQFNNLRRTCMFLIMTNISESAALLIALILGYPLPLLPVQILWLNVVTGGLTDFALSLEPSHSDSMKYPPRSPKENILNKTVLPLIIVATLTTTIIALMAFHTFLPYGVEKARTALFVVLSFSQLLTMFNLRSVKKSIFKMGLFSNRPVVITFIVSVILLFSAIYTNPLQSALRFSYLKISDIGMLFVASLVIFIFAEITKAITKKYLWNSKI